MPFQIIDQNYSIVQYIHNTVLCRNVLWAPVLLFTTGTYYTLCFPIHTCFSLSVHGFLGTVFYQGYMQERYTDSKGWMRSWCWSLSLYVIYFYFYLHMTIRKKVLTEWVNERMNNLTTAYWAWAFIRKQLLPSSFSMVITHTSIAHTFHPTPHLCQAFTYTLLLHVVR